MLDQELLQLIRHEVISFAGMPQLSCNLHFVEPARLKQHVAALYLTGQLAGSARFDAKGLMIEVRGLTVAGVARLRAHEARYAK